jgi:hypothetical protein
VGRARRACGDRVHRGVRRRVRLRDTRRDVDRRRRPASTAFRSLASHSLRRPHSDLTFATCSRI